MKENREAVGWCLALVFVFSLLGLIGSVITGKEWLVISMIVLWILLIGVLYFIG